MHAVHTAVGRRHKQVMASGGGDRPAGQSRRSIVDECLSCIGNTLLCLAITVFGFALALAIVYINPSVLGIDPILLDTTVKQINEWTGTRIEGLQAWADRALPQSEIPLLWMTPFGMLLGVQLCMMLVPCCDRSVRLFCDIVCCCTPSQRPPRAPSTTMGANMV